MNFQQLYCPYKQRKFTTNVIPFTPAYRYACFFVENVILVLYHHVNRTNNFKHFIFHLINPFISNVQFWAPWKHHKTKDFSDVFRGIKRENWEEKG